MKQNNFPIDEVDAQTLFTTIRYLHERKQMGSLVAAYKLLGAYIAQEGVSVWDDRSGEDTSSQTGQ